MLIHFFKIATYYAHEFFTSETSVNMWQCLSSLLLTKFCQNDLLLLLLKIRVLQKE